MRLVTVSGPPSSGKTSVIVHAARELARLGVVSGIAKFDALSSADQEIYESEGIPIVTGISGGICPDHFFVTNIGDCLSWAREHRLDMLISESAGLCNRCAPHIRGVLAVCVVDILSGVHTPRKSGPMLRLADMVVITKGDIVSQAERDVFAYHVRIANSRASISFANGLTGQGAIGLASRFAGAESVETLDERHLRFSMPAAVCQYCVGETAIGERYQRGYVKKMAFNGEQIAARGRP